MKHKRGILWKILLSIIGAYIIIFIIITVSKLIIILDLQSKKEKYIDNNNYYVEIISYMGNGMKKIESYHKDDKYATITTLFEDEDVKKTINYQIGDVKRQYIQENDGKYTIQDSKGFILELSISKYLYEEELPARLIQALITSVESKKCNGRECYYFSNLLPTGGVYIDKKTGLLVRAYNGTITNKDGKITDVITDYTYKFGTIAETDFVEPEHDEYSITEND